MPVLQTFTAEPRKSPLLNVSRTAPTDIYTGDGGMSQAIGKAANAFLADKEESEARKALVESSQIRAKYARVLDEAASSDADLSKIKEEMAGELSRVGDKFETAKGRDTLALYTSNTELMYDEQANRVDVQRAAVEARMEGSKFLNSASAIIQSNPLYLPSAEADADAFVATLRRTSPLQKKEIAGKLKQELNMAAALAHARIEPEKTRQRLEAGDWNLTPDQRNLAVNKADAEIRAKRTEESYERALAEFHEKEEDDKARDKHFLRIMEGTGSRRAILDDAALRPATREHLIDYMEARSKALVTTEKKSNPQEVRRLWLAIHAPDDDPRKIFTGDDIFKAVKAGQVNTTDANQLMALVANQKDENNRTIGSRISALTQNAGRAISQDPRFIGQPELVAEIQNLYAADVLDKVRTLREEKKNPSTLFDPTNKDYVGSATYVKQFVDEARARKVAEAQAQIPAPKTQEEYDAIPAGSVYTDTDGQRKVKGVGKSIPKSAPRVEAAPTGVADLAVP